MRTQHGFTLIELVLVIVLAGIMGAAIAVFLTGPMQAYVDQSARAELVDKADTALRRMGRDVRRALPNSVRLTSNGGASYLEFIQTVDGARYRETPGLGYGGPDDLLDFDAADTAFSVLGRFAGTAKPFNSNAHYLVVYNLDTTAGSPTNAYLDGGNRTPAGTAIAITADTDVDRVSLNPGYQFPERSPTRRVFLVSGPVSFDCNPATGQLRVWRGYGFSAAQPDADGDFTALGGTAALLADDVSACGFQYDPGTPQRAGLVSLRLTLSRPGTTESVRLFRQVHVINAP